MAITRQPITLDITVAGDTRTVTVQAAYRDGEPMMAIVTGLVGVIGAGSARYPATITLDPADTAPRGAHTATDQDGQLWTYTMNCRIRQARARVTGWENTAGRTNSQNQRRSS
jgi:Rieske Fe-S protein